MSEILLSPINSLPQEGQPGLVNGAAFYEETVGFGTVTEWIDHENRMVTRVNYDDVDTDPYIGKIEHDICNWEDAIYAISVALLERQYAK